MVLRRQARYLGLSAAEVEMPEAPLVAIVDDDTSIREATSNFLEAAGLSTATFGDARSFLQSVDRRSTACLITDVRMPGITGFELHEELVASGEVIPTVLITAYLDDSVRARARQVGIVCCLGKPFAPDELLGCVRAALAKSDG
jgi:FixJ family two-component response regulator